MSIKVKELCTQLYNSRHELAGLVVIGYGTDGTTHVDLAGVPEEDVRFFMHGVGVLLESASGIRVQQLAPKDPPAIIVPGKERS